MTDPFVQCLSAIQGEPSSALGVAKSTGLPPYEAFRTLKRALTLGLCRFDGHTYTITGRGESRLK